MAQKTYGLVPPSQRIAPDPKIAPQPKNLGSTVASTMKKSTVFPMTTTIAKSTAMTPDQIAKRKRTTISNVASKVMFKPYR